MPHKHAVLMGLTGQGRLRISRTRTPYPISYSCVEGIREKEALTSDSHLSLETRSLDCVLYHRIQVSKQRRQECVAKREQ